MEEAKLKQAIKTEAHRLGFSLVGVTTTEPPPHAARYQEWLDAGRHAGMGYLAAETARQRRADPRLVLNGARTILALGAGYPSPASIDPPSAGRPYGRVASYAWGNDYHAVLPPRVRELAASVQGLVSPPLAAKAYTDTGPILERDLAQRAGLGWIARNTCLTVIGRGSYFLLAELFLDVELEPDPPFTLDACGSCQRCIQACPTGCILPDRTLDAARCISYLTIEHKGPIDRALRPSMGQWVFGCDVCQMVCPWNLRFAAGAAPHQDALFPGLSPRPEVPYPDLSRDLALTPRGFNQKFKQSPLQRPHRRGYLRNVAIALGNTGDPGACVALVEALNHEPEPIVRGAAAWALGRLNTPPARLALEKALSADTEADVVDEINQALAGR